MTVGEACTRSVVTARADETIAEAARRMRDRHVGSLVVVDSEVKNRPIGILTDRDIVVSAVAQSPNKLESLLVGDVMTGEVVTARSGETVEAALMTMRTRGVRRLPVVSGDGLLEGLLAFDDVLELMSGELDERVALVAREQKHEREVRK